MREKVGGGVSNNAQKGLGPSAGAAAAPAAAAPAVILSRQIVERESGHGGEKHHWLHYRLAALGAVVAIVGTAFCCYNRFGEPAAYLFFASRLQLALIAHLALHAAHNERCFLLLHY
jgi:hypothetical protein